MRTHKVLTTDEQIDRALESTRRAGGDDRRAASAVYEKKGDRIAILLANGVIVSIPRKRLQGLEHANTAQLSAIDLLGEGTGLSWPKLDVQHYVPGLLQNVFGTRDWMAHLGRLGGASRSRAKKAAARANGAKGGRPSRARRVRAG